MFRDFGCFVGDISIFMDQNTLCCGHIRRGMKSGSTFLLTTRLQASRAITSMPQIFFTPILTFICLIVFLAYWVVIYLYLATSGTPEGNNADPVGKVINELTVCLSWKQRDSHLQV